MTAAVVFDMDGILLDSEQVWNELKRDVTLDWGGAWRDRAAIDMMGMSSLEWSAYMADELQVRRSPNDIDAEVIRRMLERYSSDLPLIPGAISAVDRLAARWPLGLASSSNRVLIDEVLLSAGLADRFQVTVSSEEVGRGKPAPDVYIEAARLLDVDPRDSAAVEDSGSGIRSAAAAGMRVIAIPNPHYPPPPVALELAHVVLGSIAELTEAAVAGA